MTLDIYDSAGFKNLDEAVENLGKLHSHLHDAIVPTELGVRDMLKLCIASDYV
jgi:hypothetical protein